MIALFFVGWCGALSARSTAATAADRASERSPLSTAHALHLNLKLDFDARTYTGIERVRWINRDNRPTSVLYFHLYANLRADNGSTGGGTSVVSALAADAVAPDEPRLEVTEVRAARAAQPLNFSLDDQAVLLRVQLREPVAAGAATEIEIIFNGSIPEIDPDETSLPAHVSSRWRGAQDTREKTGARVIPTFTRAA